MDPTSLIPAPDPIPAPWWIFEVLEQIAFIAHILMINVVVGGGFLLLWSRLKGRASDMQATLAGPSIRKLPGTLALGINAGIVPLLCIQVVYGHLFYSSSILMAGWWMWIIPLLILAYYGLYIHSGSRSYGAATLFLALALGIFLYIGFMFVNNMTLMLQPEAWSAYFTHRTGSYLHLSDPTILPKYLHFIPASIAVGGLFVALVWDIRRKRGQEVDETKIRNGLRVFAIATIVQVVTGLWQLIALPEEVMLQFMGRNMVATILLLLGFLLGIGALAPAFLGKVLPTLIHLVATVIVMALMRMMVKFAYLGDVFTPGTLELQPQYGVLILFLLVFVAGAGVLVWLVRTLVRTDTGRATQ